MWWARSEVIDLYLSSSMLAMRAGSAEPLHMMIDSDDWKLPLQAWLAELPRHRWRVWLGGQRCRLHLVDPVAGTGSIEEAEAALAASIAGDGALDMRLAVWSKGSDMPWIAIGMPAGFAGELVNSIEGQGGQLCSLRPWWSLASGKELASAAMCDDEAVHYWRTAKGHVHAAASLPMTAANRAATLQRLRVGGGLSVWQVELASPMPAARSGWAITSVSEEDGDAAGRAAV